MFGLGENAIVGAAPLAERLGLVVVALDGPINRHGRHIEHEAILVGKQQSRLSAFVAFVSLVAVLVQIAHERKVLLLLGHGVARRWRRLARPSVVIIRSCGGNGLLCGLFGKVAQLLDAEVVLLTVGDRGELTATARLAAERTDPEERMLGLLELHPLPALVRPVLALLVAAALHKFKELLVGHLELGRLESAHSSQNEH